MKWLEPWCPVNPDADVTYKAELLREVGEAHPLHGLSVAAVGRRLDSDDVLFSLPEGRLAVVHLTWTGHTESHPAWPHTDFYAGWADFETNRMLVDHEKTLI